jgi:putative AlgH/UPF0301 family transcriptional regulator
MSAIEKKQNIFLISNPNLASPGLFTEAVVYLFEYSKMGAGGFIINKNPTHNTTTLTHPFISSKLEVLTGGPLANNKLFLLYQELNQPIRSLSCINSIQNHIETDSQQNYLLIKGLSAWKASQLEYEIKNNHWIPCLPSISFFKVKQPDRYSYALKKMKMHNACFYSFGGRA